ncbi:hypothetical protein KKC94_05990, partial [Patescibacteria group bacterium]|nr:hypothetical protein [Patescibacteria group bacterium]
MAKSKSKSKSKSLSWNFLIILVLLIAVIVVMFVMLKPQAIKSNKAERAARAMAESSCLLFDEQLTFEDIGDATNDIVIHYGFKNPEEIDTYLSQISGTEEQNELSIYLRKALDENC